MDSLIYIFFVQLASVVVDFIVVVFVVPPIPNLRITLWRQKFPFLTVKNFCVLNSTTWLNEIY